VVKKLDELHKLKLHTGYIEKRKLVDEERLERLAREQRLDDTELEHTLDKEGKLSGERVG
jgi:hypothetical protein